MLIEVKVRVARIIDGKTKRKSETYIVDKEFFSNAEYDVSSILNSEQTSGEVETYEIISLRQSAIKEIDEQSMDSTIPSFIATLRDIFHDDEGNEKQLKYKVLLWAENVTAATARANSLSHQGYDMLVEGIKQVDYEYICPQLETEQGN